MWINSLTNPSLAKAVATVLSYLTVYDQVFFSRQSKGLFQKGVTKKQNNYKYLQLQGGSMKLVFGYSTLF